MRMELFEKHKSESMFMNLLESAPDAMVITNHKGIIQLVNAQTENLFGYSRDEILGAEIEVLIPERFRPKHIIHTKGYLAVPKVRAMGVGMDLFGRRKDGSEFPVAISLSPMKDSGDNEPIVMAAIRDITKQKENESEIILLNQNLESLVVERTAELEIALENEKTARMESRHNEERLALLSTAGEVLISSLDYSQTLTNVTKLISPQFADWCAIDEIQEDRVLKRLVVSHPDSEKTRMAFELAKKYSLYPDKTHGIFEVYRTLEPEIYESVTDEMLQEEAVDEDHLSLMRRLGIKSVILLPLHLRNKLYGVLTLVMSESGRYFESKDLDVGKELAQRITIALENAKLYKESQDINAVLEQKVARRTQELEAINKELEAFSYSVSHDLRAPLRSIDGFSNLIARDCSHVLDEQGKSYFKRVQNASQQMGHLIDDMLKLARISRLDMNLETTNLSEIAERIADELKSQDPGRKVDFIIQESITAFADQHLLEIVLQNLLSNAWKYSKNNPQALIEFGTKKQDSGTLYFIRDNGAGFDMKYVEKLFGAFQRLHSIKEFEGTGVGLATVQRIIRRHHGTIWANGEVENGATFFFTLNTKHHDKQNDPPG